MCLIKPHKFTVSKKYRSFKISLTLSISVFLNLYSAWGIFSFCLFLLKPWAYGQFANVADVITFCSKWQNSKRWYMFIPKQLKMIESSSCLLQPSKHFLGIRKHNKTNFLDDLWFSCSFWKVNFTNILGFYNTQLRDNSHQRIGMVNSELRKLKGTIYQKTYYTQMLFSVICLAFTVQK